MPRMSAAARGPGGAMMDSRTLPSEFIPGTINHDLDSKYDKSRSRARLMFAWRAKLMPGFNLVAR